MAALLHTKATDLLRTCVIAVFSLDNVNPVCLSRWLQRGALSEVNNVIILRRMILFQQNNCPQCSLIMIIPEENFNNDKNLLKLTFKL